MECIKDLVCWFILDWGDFCVGGESIVGGNFLVMLHDLKEENVSNVCRY